MATQDSSLSFFVSLSKLNKTIVSAAKERIKPHGLNMTEFAILELLLHKGMQNAQHIGERILLTSGSVTYVVNALEKRGLVTRAECKEDRRVVYVDLTPAGRDCIETVFPEHAAHIAQMLSCVDEAVLLDMKNTMKRMGRFIQETGKESS